MIKLYMHRAKTQNRLSTHQPAVCLVFAVSNKQSNAIKYTLSTLAKISCMTGLLIGFDRKFGLIDAWECADPESSVRWVPNLVTFFFCLFVSFSFFFSFFLCS